MRLEQRFEISAPIERVWEFIMSPHEVAPCVPGCESVEELGDNRYLTVVTVRVGPIKARFKLEVEIKERFEPYRAVIFTRGEEGGKMSSVSVQSTLVLERLDAQQTELAYSSDISVMGRLGNVGLGMMRKKAEKLGNEFAATLREHIQATAAT